MKRLFEFLWYGHFHKWKILETSDIVEYDERTKIGRSFTLQCEKCGNLQRKNFFCHDRN